MFSLNKKILDFFFGMTDLSLRHERQKQLLRIMTMMIAILTLISFFSILVLDWIGVFIGDSPSVSALYVACIFVVVGFSILYFLSFKIPSRLASFLFVFLLSIAIVMGDTPYQMIHGQGLFYMSIPIVFAGVLLKPYAGFWVAVINTIILIIFQVRLGDPVINLMIVIVFFIFAFVIWVVAESYERAIQKLGMVNDALVESEERDRERVQLLQQLTQQVLTAQEDERRRISRELHDESGQALSGLMYQLDEVLESLPRRASFAREKLSSAIEELIQAKDQIRTLAHKMRPSALDVAGLSISLASLCRDVSEKTGLLINYEGETQLPLLPEVTNISLYRITQEALTNIIRHAHASSVTVTLSSNQDDLMLAITDNGVGFDHLSDKTGIGLIGMGERIAFLRGRLEIDSKPNGGTRLNICIPLPADRPVVSPVI